MGDLFILPPHVAEAAALRQRHRIRGHAGQPGAGPAGETCKSCAHYERKEMSKTYLKCGLMSAHWTGGAGTDIRASDPACPKWTKPTQAGGLDA